MQQNDDGPAPRKFLLDEYALERSMAKGSPEEHSLLEGVQRVSYSPPPRSKRAFAKLTPTMRTG